MSNEESSQQPADIGEQQQSANQTDEAPNQSSSLKRKTIIGSIWALASHGSNQVLRLGGNLILTRLLFPEAFGLMTLVQTFMAGLHMFSDIGIFPNIIQDKRGDDPAFLNTAWTVQVIRGACLWLGSCVIAIPAAQFYNQPMLMLLLPVTGGFPGFVIGISASNWLIYIMDATFFSRYGIWQPELDLPVVGLAALMASIVYFWNYLPIVSL